MYKIFYFVVFFCLLFSQVFANEYVLTQKNTIQSRVDEIGTKILNHNKITKRVIFVYDPEAKRNILEIKNALNKRQVIVYDDLYKSAQTDDEIAAMLAREISLAVRSYDGDWGGRIDSLQIVASPKKFSVCLSSILNLARRSPENTHITKGTYAIIPVWPDSIIYR